MTLDVDAEVERLFELVLSADHDTRAGILDQECHDPAVRHEVESLLVADAEAGSFLEPPRRGARGVGARIGAYRLVKKLGEGEASCVYLAARDDQYRQWVAIKLIRPGVAAPQILKRFHQERQILANLAHANIARLLDGGETPDGQPYFIMEYVDGEPLDVHCQRCNLPLARRLELFITVCQAVHFAHRNLIVHRDLKPGNILVDADGNPKLLDFGIAKLLDPDGAIVPVEPTAAVTRLMTPHYASPEQVQGLPVSTASDVYSLGVILYKLITGQRPYELSSHTLQEIERVVCEMMPLPPSQRVRGSRKERLPRDLDNIVLMALRKEPERRYASVLQLADDLRHCLERRPVLARRDTLGYRVSSFVRRNTGAVIAAAVLVASLIGGTIATTWQWRNAVAAQSRADDQRRTAEQSLDFVVEMFKVPHPSVAMNDVTARTLLDSGVARLSADLQLPPNARAALQHTLGRVYRNLGDYPEAAALLEQALAVRSQLPDDPLELADTLYVLGTVEAEVGKLDGAEASLRRALAIRTQLLGQQDASVADVLEALADNNGYTVPVREAEDDLRRAIEIRRHHLADSRPHILADMAMLAELYSVTGDYADAEAVFQEAIAMRDRLAGGPRCDVDDGEFLDHASILRYRQGYFADSERYFNEAIACNTQLFGPDHVYVLDLLSLRVLLWFEQGRYADAEDLARRNLMMRQARHGPKSPAVDHSLHLMAIVLYERGKLAEAEQSELASLTIRKSFGRANGAVASSLVVLGDIRLAGGDANAAESSYREALANWQQAMSEDRPSAAAAMTGLARALLAQGKLGAASAMAERALAVQRHGLRPMHPAIAGTLVVLGRIEQARGSSQRAASLFREALAIQRAVLTADHPYVARVESLLGQSLADQQRIAEALPLLRHGVDVLRVQLGDDHIDTRRARERLHAAEGAYAQQTRGASRAESQSTN
jgi:serine/threonine-protein kinase